MNNNQFKDTELLLRAVLPSEIYWENGSLSSAAFKDRKGLSVDRVNDRNLEIAVEKIKTTLRGSIVSVFVRDCHDVSACVKYLPSQNNPYHCEIHHSEKVKLLDEIQAKHLASVAQIQYDCMAIPTI
ncbi:MAG: hypothetical protein IKM44_00370 [Clostridia bacterium]|nr:hypothetical protein [Clostridia bacterium]